MTIPKNVFLHFSDDNLDSEVSLTVHTFYIQSTSNRRSKVTDGVFSGGGSSEISSRTFSSTTAHAHNLFQLTRCFDETVATIAAHREPSQ